MAGSPNEGVSGAMAGIAFGFDLSPDPRTADGKAEAEDENNHLTIFLAAQGVAKGSRDWLTVSSSEVVKRMARSWRPP